MYSLPEVDPGFWEGGGGGGCLITMFTTREGRATSSDSKEVHVWEPPVLGRGPCRFFAFAFI